jgi:ubiquinone/menaquinone biosynthesis C-methylase UbiE
LKEAKFDMTPDAAQHAEEALEEMYIAIREKEGRTYNDKQVAQLPNIDAKHRYYKEWKKRQRSSQRLITYLKAIQRPLNILEIGCGNGWLTNKLAKIPHAKVTGLDPNGIEIEQARRVFNKPNLQFVHKGFDKDTFDGKVKFDVIIFAASLQYFPSVKTVITEAFALLNPNGKVHVLDTPFYHKDQVETAASRCQKYYTEMGFPEMAEHYFHHTMSKLHGFKQKILFDPRGFWNKLMKRDVFYWIMLKP